MGSLLFAKASMNYCLHLSIGLLLFEKAWYSWIWTTYHIFLID